MKQLYLFFRSLVSALSLILLFSAVQTTTPLQAQSASGITSPAPGSSVNGAVPIIGTAAINSFQRYELYYKPEPSGDDSYIYFDGDTRQVTNGQLGVWQTGDFAPGLYTLRMRVVKADGNYSEHFVPNLSVNQQVETPTPTPTETPSGPTATPIPIDTPTSVPQPTPAVVDVQQPNLGETPPANPTPTAELVALGASADNNTGGNADTGSTTSVGVETTTGVEDTTATEGSVTGFTAELGAAISLERLRERFITGVRYAAGIFLIVFAIFAGKRLLEWTLSRAG
jgi:hypothetical protein